MDISYEQVIKQLRPSCSCTTATVSRKIIKPGEAATVDLEFRFFQRYGRQTNHVRVITSSGAIHTVTLETTIPRAFELIPEKLSWSQGEEPTAKSMVLKTTGGKPVSILNVRTDSGRNFSASFEVLESGKSYEVTVQPRETGEEDYELILCETDLIYPETGKPKIVEIRAFVDKGQGY